MLWFTSFKKNFVFQKIIYIIILLIADKKQVLGKENPNLQILINQASEEELVKLNAFSHTLLSSTECGYVLYGEKPVFFVSINNPLESSPQNNSHYNSNSLRNGLEIWKKLNLPMESENYIFHILVTENKKEQIFDFLAFNKSAFKNAFEENKNLFKYILGPEITAERLLTTLTDPKENFYKVLKDNTVLLGILLGFGTENSLYVNRQELIQYTSVDAKESLIEPSYGYTSIDEEYEDLIEKISICSTVLDEEFPILCFGCLKETDLSKKLINHYENVQLQLIQILDSNNTLENLLERFYNVKINLSITKKKNTNEFLKRINRDFPQIKKVKNYIPINWANLIAYYLWNGCEDIESIDYIEFVNNLLEGMHKAD